MAGMKSWHIVVLDGCKTIEEHEKHSVKDANTLYDELKEKYKDKIPQYAVKREWY